MSATGGPRGTLTPAFIVKAVWDLPTTRHLIDRLKVDSTLRRLCGWSRVGEILSAIPAAAPCGPASTACWRQYAGTRSARNGRDWHPLIEFAAWSVAFWPMSKPSTTPGCPPTVCSSACMAPCPNSRPRTSDKRSEEGARRKAARGELFIFAAVGDRRLGRDGIEMDPDLRVREAVSLVFRKFRELQGVRQVHLWLVQEGIELPSSPPGQDRVRWEAPGYSRVNSILTNPVYAGAYVFGRTGNRVSIRDGRKHVTRGHAAAREDWQVLKKDNHDGYVTWDEFEMTQRVLSDNASTFYPSGSRGAVRGGEALLAGLLRCGHCGRGLQVAYTGTKSDVLRYVCRSGNLNQDEKTCISVGGRLADAAVGGEIVRVLQPIGMDAALRAIEDSSETVRQTELALERARYEAGRAWR